MLVLSRKKDQRIFINDDTIITIVKIDCNIVRLGFDAPKSVRIVREEVTDKSKILTINQELIDNDQSIAM